MEHKEAQKQIILPVIQRLDRLENQLNYIERQKNSPAPTEETGNECHMHKDLSTVLEEVPFKGSLLERVTSLERRVLKLTQQIEEERSESFKKSTFDSCRCTFEEKLQDYKKASQNEDTNRVLTQDKEQDLEVMETQIQELDAEKRQRKNKRKINSKSRYRKWVTSIPTWC